MQDMFACYWGCWSNKSVRSMRSLRNTKYVAVVFMRLTVRLLGHKESYCVYANGRHDCQCRKQNVLGHVSSSVQRIATWLVTREYFAFFKEYKHLKRWREILVIDSLKQSVPRVTDSCLGDRMKLLTIASYYSKILLLCLQQQREVLRNIPHTIVQEI